LNFAANLPGSAANLLAGAMEVNGSPTINRTFMNANIPICQGSDVAVTKRPCMNVDGHHWADDRLWFDISGADNKVFWQKLAKSKLDPKLPDLLCSALNFASSLPATTANLLAGAKVEAGESPPINRTFLNANIPIFQGSQVLVTKRPPLNFHGRNPANDGVWFGAIEFEIDGDQWVLEKFLNYGSEGQTYSAVHTASGRRCALKFCKSQSSRELELVKTMPRKLVEHPNLVTYKMLVLNCGSQFKPAQHIIFMEQVPNGELFDFLVSGQRGVMGRPVSEGTSRRFLHDVIIAMAECYRFGLTHRDLKPENLLLNEEGRLVIIDMGHAKVAPVANQDDVPNPPPLKKAMTANKYGTREFNAPEAVTGKQYDCEESDVWAVGMIAFILHAKLPAFGQGQGVAKWSDISGADNGVFWQKIAKSRQYPKFSDNLKQFVNTMWRTNPTERPSFGQLELAISGDVETLSQFPGLQWLAQPTNDIDTFAAELRRALPNIVLSFGKPSSRHMQAKSWFKRCSWCGV